MGCARKRDRFLAVLRLGLAELVLILPDHVALHPKMNRKLNAVLSGTSASILG